MWERFFTTTVFDDPLLKEEEIDTLTLTLSQGPRSFHIYSSFTLLVDMYYA